ncbi:hypothetical protein CXG81DRAFT_13389 [Caulochytrium protostelioides]|uniref:Dolichyl-diphosphooligosaccharide--protein glycosyltransferase subunit OST2 n=1 Tax=Caulochytrium protostelioides TaxID=1555241 RepID=A0A4P9X5B6_9FUNG|nr:DAD-domain-containing protein [Caulochytrium protostelioides]RKP00316.1 hypothetical protein CXG81DRAFT_13389 [Caulochytrium protostelioides]|eukprot:RKP00316.1 hypothetical protein CXG81DRAFT_13389 [Caulochytrium protostelioides]
MAAATIVKKRVSTTRTTVTTRAAITTASAPTKRDKLGKPLSTAGASADPHRSVFHILWTRYCEETTPKLMWMDLYLVAMALTGAVQFVYVLLAGADPFNPFLAGFIASVGNFCLAVNLRLQSHPATLHSLNISPERAFADYVVCSLILYAFCANYL